MANLMEGLLDEIERVGKIVTLYEELPMGAGMIGASLMKADISRAKKAISESDVVQMVQVYQSLKEFHE
jgi:hypothetical protein